MLRTLFVFLAVCVLLSSESRSHAGVTMSSSVIDTPGRPGFKTATVYASSDTRIYGLDFVGDAGSDPATDKGFFGLLNQASSLSPTVFDIHPDGEPLPDLTYDSHFLIKDVPLIRDMPIIANEGPNVLQAYVWALWPQSARTPIAQLVIPNGTTVTYRGTIIALSRKTTEEFDISGVIVAVPEPTTTLLTLAASGLLFTTRQRV